MSLSKLSLWSTVSLNRQWSLCLRTCRLWWGIKLEHVIMTFCFRNRCIRKWMISWILTRRLDQQSKRLCAHLWHAYSRAVPYRWGLKNRTRLIGLALPCMVRKNNRLIYSGRARLRRNKTRPARRTQATCKASIHQRTRKEKRIVSRSQLCNLDRIFSTRN